MQENKIMVSVAEALKIIEEQTKPLSPVNRVLKKAGGMVSGEDIFSPLDIPAFPQSSMDGYAFSFAGWQQNKKLKITGEVAAGSNETFVLAPENTVRIFTGAAVPPGADTVIMQEKIKIDTSAASAGELKIEDELIQPGNSVRPKGSEIKAGALALQKETTLTPAAIGFLAGIGITEIKVYPNPAISIIITGNELQQPGQPLHYGQIYESNSFTLKTALQQLNIDDAQIIYVTDKPGLVTDALSAALKESDVVLVTGGISVGDYDFVLQATKECGVQELFHKIKQRPGKPLYFGKKENKLVFGLPGNPSSVLTCFYEYVLPALEILTKRKISLQKIQVPLFKPFSKTTNLTHFLKGFYNGAHVTVLDAQESYRLSSFAKANCLVRIDEEVMECKEGEQVEIHLLPV